MKRRLVQLYVALMYNLNLKGFAEVSIYKGKWKGLYVPGLSYYSCPGAVGSCSLGALQNSLVVMDKKLPFCILGTLLFFGITLSRIICGFLCPFGFLQELFYKIPLPKIKKNRFTMALSGAKYAVLAVFVIVLSTVLKAATRVPISTFYKYICSTGTLKSSIPLILLDESLGGLTGVLFSWKVLVLTVILLSACFLCRSLCRFLRPLSAVYSLFTPVALLGVKVDHDMCMDCGPCVHTCKIDIRHVGDMGCIQYGECTKGCRVDAIHWKEPFER